MSVEIIRGTTPTLDFPIENTSIIKELELTFSQCIDGETLTLQKELGKGEVELYQDYVRIRLSEEETFTFSTGAVSLQMRILSKNGNVAASNIERIKIMPSLSEDILSKEAANE